MNQTGSHCIAPAADCEYSHMPTFAPPPVVPSAPAAATRPRRFVLGISGASGAAYALRLLEQLLLTGAEVHLVVTDYGRRLLFDEAQVTHVEFASMCPTISD